MDRRTKKYEKLKQRLNSIGWIAKGSVMTLYRTCGKPGCACAKDKQARHGPYLVWTKKVKGKTVTRNLTESQARKCRQAIENFQRLESVVAEMKVISALAIEIDTDDAPS